ncbi:MAG TPA: hypothetical protein VE932_07130 [Patescibacteria group bacterium]|nr:hypothetical protein [Patescibacteria group bacterium]
MRRFVWEQCQVTVDGTAGRFSAWVPGWPFRGAPSRLVLKPVAAPGLQ